MHVEHDEHVEHGQGERRFYLGAVVDDLFLTTGQWEYDAPDFEGPLVSRVVLWVGSCSVKHVPSMYVGNLIGYESLGVFGSFVSPSLPA